MEAVPSFKLGNQKKKKTEYIFRQIRDFVGARQSLLENRECKSH